MAWCRQATSHCLSQCWPRSLSPYGVIRPQWVNTARLYGVGKYANHQVTVAYVCGTGTTSIATRDRWRHRTQTIACKLKGVIMSRRLPSHYRSQCWLFVSWAIGKKLPWNLNQNTKLFWMKMHCKFCLHNVHHFRDSSVSLWNEAAIQRAMVNTLALICILC